MPFRETIPMRLRRAYLTVHRAAQAHFAQFDVTADQYVLLSRLGDEEGITQKELSARMFSDGNTITAMVRLLERKDLIRRERCIADCAAFYECLDRIAEVMVEPPPIAGDGRSRKRDRCPNRS